MGDQIIHGALPSSVDYRTVAGDGLGAHIGYGDLEALFEMHFQAIRRAQLSVSKPGLLALAYDVGTASLAARHWIKCRQGAIETMVLGRHRNCDLVLSADPAISLRHLMLITHPYTGGEGQICFRAMDLRTTLAFRDCFNNRIEGLVSDGPAVFCVGRYALFVLPTGLRPIDETVRGAWGQIADPVYLEQHTQIAQAAGQPADRPSPSESEGAQEEARTAFTLIAGPQRAGAGLLDRNEDLLGTLTVSASGRSHPLLLGRRAAAQGVLMGSYERCDDACLSHVDDAGISRVHLVVLLHEGKLYSIDTASTNGCFAEQPGRRVKVRIAKLSPLFELVLGDNRARLYWEPESSQ